MKEQSQTEPTIMKKNLPFVFVFAVGLICGIAINHWQTGDSPGAGSAEKETSESESIPATAAEIERILLDDFLPNTAPYWVYFDFQQWRKEKKTVEEFFTDPSVSPIWKEFCASLPQDVTPVLGQLADASNWMRFFILPPKENHPAPVLTAAFSMREATKSTEAPPGIAALVAAYPDSATETLEAGPITLQSLNTPAGEFVYLRTPEILWIGNNRDAMQQFWQQLPTPPEGKKLSPEILNDYEGTVLAFFSNIDHAGEPLTGVLGMATARLRLLGLAKAAILFQWLEEGGKMTALAPLATPLPWMEQWKPIDKFPFGKEDPAGLLEAAIRWPEPHFPASATAVLNAASGEEAIPPLAMGTPPPNRPLRENRPNRNNPNENRNEGRPRREMNRRGNEAERFALHPGHRPPLGALMQMQMRSLSRLFPAGETIGFNLFGFYDNVPTMTLTIPMLSANPSPFDILKAESGIESSTLEVAMLPATCYRFGSHQPEPMMALDELLIVERDAIAYLFDAPEAASHYLSNNQPEKGRSAEMRSLLENVKTPAQIEFVFSRDFFRYILEWEKTEAAGDSFYQKDLIALLEKLAECTQVMSLSAGLDERQWFLETYTEDAFAHWVDTGLLLRAAFRLMQ